MKAGRNALIVAVFLAASWVSARAQQVDMELMTYPEVAAALREGKTTVLIDNGGTEQRGPHAVLGGHSLIAPASDTEEAARQQRRHG